MVHIKNVYVHRVLAGSIGKCVCYRICIGNVSLDRFQGMVDAYNYIIRVVNNLTFIYLETYQQWGRTCNLYHTFTSLKISCTRTVGRLSGHVMEHALNTAFYMTKKGQPMQKIRIIQLNIGLYKDSSSSFLVPVIFARDKIHCFVNSLSNICPSNILKVDRFKAR